MRKLAQHFVDSKRKPFYVVLELVFSFTRLQSFPYHLFSPCADMCSRFVATNWATVTPISARLHILSNRLPCLWHFSQLRILGTVRAGGRKRLALFDGFPNQNWRLEFSLWDGADGSSTTKKCSDWKMMNLVEMRWKWVPPSPVLAHVRKLR